jgi:para-nitrobenzyl esterase
VPGVSWQPTDPDTNRTMVFDNECRMMNDPDGNARKIILA